MDFAIPSDAVVRAAVITGLLLLGLALLILLNVLLLGVRATLQARRDSQFRETWQPVMAAAAVGDVPPELPTLHWADHQRFLLLWNRMQQSLRGSARDHLNTLLQRTGMDRVARLHLEAGSTRASLIAINTFRHLLPEDTANRLLRLAREAPGPIAIAAARTLAGIDQQEHTATLVAIMLQRRDWSSTHCLDIVRTAPSQRAAAALLPAFREGSPAARERLLPLLECVQPMERAPALRAFLGEHPDDPLTAPALDLLTVARDPVDAELMRGFLGHPQAHVRAIAVWGLGKLGGGESDFQRMQALLCDPSWQVRQSAAAALVVLPDVDRVQLQRLVDGLGDAYGRLALERALEASA